MVINKHLSHHEFVSEQATFNGQSAFVFEGIENTHVVEFGIVSVDTSKKGSQLKSEIDTALEKKTGKHNP